MVPRYFAIVSSHILGPLAKLAVGKMTTGMSVISGPRMKPMSPMS
jgi:hypothetical protein